MSTPSTLPDFNPSGSETVAELKMRGEQLLQFIMEHVPEGRERSIALTNIEQGMMWAVKANFVKRDGNEPRA